MRVDPITNCSTTETFGQFERLLEWAREVSKKTGIPLKNL